MRSQLLRRFLLIFCCLLPLHQLSAQDFVPIRPGHIQYYTDHAGVFIAIAIDSIRESADTTWYYNYPTIKEYGYDNWCWKAAHASWLGSACFLTDSVLHMINRGGDTIRLPLWNDQHADWSLLEEDGGKYISTYTEIYTEDDFLNELDTVLSIFLTTYGYADDVSYHIYTLGEIRISKKHGLIKFPDFYEFPYEADWPTTTSTSSFELVGRDSIGLIPIGLEDAFDMLPGEVFHYIDNYQCIPYTKGESKEIHTILDRWYSSNRDSVFFSIERIIKRTTMNFDDNYMPLPDTTIYVHDTLQKRYYIGALYPFEPSHTYEDEIIQYQVSVRSSYPGRQQIVKGEPFWKSDDGCFSPIISDGNTYFYYVEGLGEMHYSSSPFCLFNGEGSREVVYFKKENEEWGEPLSRSELSPITHYQAADDIKVYPVPFSHQLIIDNHTRDVFPASVQIFDSMGRQVFEQEVFQSGTSLNTSSFPEGMYLLRIKMQDGQVYNESLLKSFRE